MSYTGIDNGSWGICCAIDFSSKKLRHRPDTEVLPHIYVDFEVRIIFQGIPYAPLPAAAEAAGIKKIHVG